MSGTITDPTGNPLPGVSIVQVGTTNGTSPTPMENTPSRCPDENSVLRFSFIGFATQDVTVGNRTSVDIVLQEDINQWAKSW